MKIAELEKQLQISRANIRFYEKEGLINPKRNSNGYRDYCDEDIIRLKKIIIFRKLGISVPEIKDIFEQNLSISDAVDSSIENLNKQIESLTGALEVCKVIQKDSHADSNFDQEKYWDLIHSKEINGQHFEDFIKDYMQLEKKAFFSMWKNVFLLNIEKFVKNHGWLATFCFLLFACVIRGLVRQYILKSGSFLYGFLYPFVLLAFGTLFILPLYLLERKYKEQDIVNEVNTQKSKKDVLFPLLGSIVYVAVLLFGIPTIMENFYDSIFGNNTTYVLTSNMFIVYLAVGLYLLFTLLWLFSKQGILSDESDSEPGLKAHLSKKAKIKLATYSIVVFLLSIATYMSWFNCFTSDSLRTQRLFWSKEYTWYDVDYYKLSASFDGTLKYTVVMKDGTKATCLGTSISMYNEDEADENLCRALTKKFTDMGIKPQVKDWDKLEKNLTYDYWKDFARELKALTSTEK